MKINATEKKMWRAEYINQIYHYVEQIRNSENYEEWDNEADLADWQKSDNEKRKERVKVLDEILKEIEKM